EARTGKEVRRFPGHETNGAAALSPDGRLLAAAAWDGAVWLWDTARGVEIRKLEAPRGASSVAFAPDGRSPAAGAYGGSGEAGGEVITWEVVTGKERGRCTGRRGAVLALAFSPDGKLLASAGADTTALVWDVRALALGDGRAPGRLPAEEAEGL